MVVSRIDSSKVIDTERFLDNGAPVIEGKNAKRGTQYLYYIREGVCITCNAECQEGEWFSQDELFYIDIVNNSDHGIMFDLDKVRIVGNKNKAKGKIESTPWIKYTPESYEDYIK